MDRKTWLAVGLSILGLVLWQWYYSATYGPYLAQQEEERARIQAEAAAAAAAATPGATAATGTAAVPTPTPAPVPTPDPTALVAQMETLSAGDGADFTFNNDTGGIATAVLLLHLGENREAVGLNRDPRFPIGAIAFEPGNPVGGFTMNVGTDRVTFTKTEPDGLQIEKIFSLTTTDSETDPYVLALEVNFRNTGATPVSRGTYFLSTGGAAPIHENDLPHYTRFDWYQNGKMESIDVNWFGGSSVPLIGIQLRAPAQTFRADAENIAWASVSSQYFCTIVSVTGGDETTPPTPGTAAWSQRTVIPSKEGRALFGIQGALGMPGFELAPGTSKTAEFEIYAGPKDLSRLRTLPNDQEAVMNFGMFGFVSKFLLWAMNSLHGFIGNYAGAIIVLTLLIKTALWPLQNKATQSMKRMALLSPKMTELREKYKDDPAKMNEELMKLYRDYSVNPFSGCLPMLIQIPIFFGFYSMLGTAIELRNSSFLWVTDLSQPDTVFRVMGFPINVLPLVMAGTMVWQMAVTPKTGDKNQQRILMFMPIIFVVFAYNYASALSLYWTTQNLFSIVQLYLTRNQPLPQLEKKAVAAKRNAPTATKKKRQRRSLP